jgi:hypothetical protein
LPRISAAITPLSKSLNNSLLSNAKALECLSHALQGIVYSEAVENLDSVALFYLRAAFCAHLLNAPSFVPAYLSRKANLSKRFARDQCTLGGLHKLTGLWLFVGVLLTQADNDSEKAP